MGAFNDAVRSDAQRSERMIRKQGHEMRKRLSQEAEAQGHKLTDWSEYPSQDGKWTTYCRKCGGMYIAYDDMPMWGDQIVTPKGDSCVGENA